MCCPIYVGKLRLLEVQSPAEVIKLWPFPSNSALKHNARFILLTKVPVPPCRQTNLWELHPRGHISLWPWGRTDIQNKEANWVRRRNMSPYSHDVFFPPLTPKKWEQKWVRTQLHLYHFPSFTFKEERKKSTHSLRKSTWTLPELPLCPPPWGLEHPDNALSPHLLNKLAFSPKALYLWGTLTLLLRRVLRSIERAEIQNHKKSNHVPGHLVKLGGKHSTLFWKERHAREVLGKFRRPGWIRTPQRPGSSITPGWSPTDVQGQGSEAEVRLLQTWLGPAGALGRVKASARLGGPCLRVPHLCAPWAGQGEDTSLGPGAKEVRKPAGTWGEACWESPPGSCRSLRGAEPPAGLRAPPRADWWGPGGRKQDGGRGEGGKNFRDSANPEGESRGQPASANPGRAEWLLETLPQPVLREQKRVWRAFLSQSRGSSIGRGEPDSASLEGAVQRRACLSQSRGCIGHIGQALQPMRERCSSLQGLFVKTTLGCIRFFWGCRNWIITQTRACLRKYKLSVINV